MKEPHQETAVNLSNTFIAVHEMASGPSEKVKEPFAPQVMSDNKYRVKVESSYHCRETGIKFDVDSTTTIEYSLEYGNHYMNLIQENGYELLGPIFNVRVKSGRVTAVYLPHYVCLEDFRGDKTRIKFGDFKDGKVTLKIPTKLESSYVVLENPTFSCVAPVAELTSSFWRKKKPIPFNGHVLLYARVVCAEEEEFMEYRIHLYLIPTDRPHLMKLDDQKRLHGFKRIVKPPLASSVYRDINYTIMGKPQPDIWPKTLQFMVHEQIEYCSFSEINIVQKSFSKDAKQISLGVKEERSPESEPVWRGRLTRDIEELSRQAVQRGTFTKTFVDEYRPELIEKVKNIKPVLDDLKQKELLKEEECSNITCQPTKQEMMRALYEFAENWGAEDKEKLYQALMRHNEPVIKEIGRKN